MNDNSQKDIANRTSCAVHSARRVCTTLVLIGLVLGIVLLYIPLPLCTWFAQQKVSVHLYYAVKLLLVMSVLMAIGLCKRTPVVLMAIVLYSDSYLCVSLWYLLTAVLRAIRLWQQFHFVSPPSLIIAIFYPLPFSFLLAPPFIGMYALLRRLTVRR
jgi:hypothetical protein